MKIAVCISGQIRTGVEASINIKNYLGTLLQYCDFFIHTWDINNYVGFNGINIFPNNEKITDENIQSIIDIYEPKKIVVEDFEKTKDKISKFDTLKYLWYSFYKSVQYKKEYEIDNNFEYDLVLKLRFDILFPPHRSLAYEYKLLIDNIDNMVYIENAPDFVSIDDTFIDDVYFFSNSKNMNIFCEYYNNMGLEYNGFELIKYLNINNIIHYKPKNFKFVFNENIDYFKYTVYRYNCLKYLPIKEFKKCDDCNNYYYSFNPVDDFITGKYIYELENDYYIDDILKTEQNFFVDDLLVNKNKIKKSELLLKLLKLKSKLTS